MKTHIYFPEYYLTYVMHYKVISDIFANAQQTIEPHRHLMYFSGQYSFFSPPNYFLKVSECRFVAVKGVFSQDTLSASLILHIFMSNLFTFTDQLCLEILSLNLRGSSQTQDTNLVLFLLWNNCVWLIYSCPPQRQLALGSDSDTVGDINEEIYARKSLSLHLYEQCLLDYL